MRKLSGYRIVWALVMFDLPVETFLQRKEYQRFRDYLLDEGFMMAQYSVYLKHCSGKEQFEALAKRIERRLPPNGVVDILLLTDKQYEKIIRYQSSTLCRQNKNPDQLVLF